VGEASGASYESLAGAAPYVAPGDEDEDEVLVEVFEHERVQPLRGWGHTWPGHFLPSDKVGHWGDRQGAPGGMPACCLTVWRPSCQLAGRGRMRSGRWTWWTRPLRPVTLRAGRMAWTSHGCSGRLPQSGKAGLKSFVRRRRWVRTRMRLPPGSYDEELLGQQETQENLLAGLSSSGIPLQELTAGVCDRSASGGGGSETGLIAGLGSGLGLGSEGGAAAAATAAAAAASAMYSRFLRAVEDTVTGSGGGHQHPEMAAQPQQQQQQQQQQRLPNGLCVNWTSLATARCSSRRESR